MEKRLVSTPSYRPVARATAQVPEQSRTLALRVALLAALLLISAIPAWAAPPPVFPPTISLPNGFAPEGIAVGIGSEFFVGSILTGAIYNGDLRTGAGQILVPPQAGRAAIGLAFDERTGYLFVAGGPTGNAYVYDSRTGATVESYAFATAPTFVNDVVVTRDAAYFTDSFRQVLYRVPLLAGGAPADPALAQEIVLGGEYDASSTGFTINGIDATPNGKWLVIVHSGQGNLYRVDPQTGEATLIDLGGGAVPFGDGILLDGKTLYVVQNRLNQIAVVALNPELTAGEITGTLTDPGFDVPTTIAEFGNTLYAVNARFGTPVTPDTTYSVVGVTKQ